MSDHKRIAIFGGSFDPPHLGHTKLVSFFWKEFPETKRLFIIPNRVSPLKSEKYFSETEVLRLTRTAFSEFTKTRSEIFSGELDRPGPSFSFETILELKKQNPGSKLDYIIGEDQLSQLPGWKEPAILLREVDRFIVFRRNTEPDLPVRIPIEFLTAKFEILNNPLWEESSTAWRTWPSADGLDPKVAEEIRNFFFEKFPVSVWDSWIKKAESELTETRWSHCKKVSEIAEELAIHWGYLIPEKAKLAGLLHDLTKQKTKEFHLEIFKKKPEFNYYELPTEAYHAFSARYLLESAGVNDYDLLLSIQNHTLGSENMSVLEKIMYASDFLGSDFALINSDYQDWVSSVFRSLDFGLFLKSKMTISDLLEKKKKIHPYTFSVYNTALNSLQQV